ncbi:MAG: hypothetical protein PSV46_00225 [Reyranella sp.]|nr:hypothetical protein [Reyranella sp.]
MPSLTTLALLLAVAAAPAVAQIPMPPSGGPTGQFLGPPTGTVEDFIGSWDLTWEGPTGSGCPCSGVLTIELKRTASGEGLVGIWSMKGAAATLRGPVSYHQTVWAGDFAQPFDSSDYPMKGSFRLLARDSRTLTGSYRRDGTAVPFSWTATRD